MRVADAEPIYDLGAGGQVTGYRGGECPSAMRSIAAFDQRERVGGDRPVADIGEMLRAAMKRSSLFRNF